MNFIFRHKEAFFSAAMMLAACSAAVPETLGTRSNDGQAAGGLRDQNPEAGASSGLPARGGGASSSSSGCASGGPFDAPDGQAPSNCTSVALGDGKTCQSWADLYTQGSALCEQQGLYLQVGWVNALCPGIDPDAGVVDENVPSITSVTIQCCPTPPLNDGSDASTGTDSDASTDACYAIQESYGGSPRSYESAVQEARQRCAAQGAILGKYEPVHANATDFDAVVGYQGTCCPFAQR